METRSLNTIKLRHLIVALCLPAVVGCVPEGSGGRGVAGELRVSSTPSGATLFINGEAKGVTGEPERPFSVALPSGHYRLEAELRNDELAVWRQSAEVEFDANKVMAPVHLVLDKQLTAAGEAHAAAEKTRLQQLQEKALAHFEPQADGTVLQPQRGLMWMRCSLGQTWTGTGCSGEAKKFSHAQAEKAAAAMRFAGYEDWRLPTQPELLDLLYCSSGARHQFKSDGMGGGCVGEFRSPTILDSVFPDTPPGNYWSSTPNERLAYSAWGVSFNTGHTGTGGRTEYVHVRLVRDVK